MVFAPLADVAHAAGLQVVSNRHPAGESTQAGSVRYSPQDSGVRYVERSLASILHSLKSFTSNQANKLLDRKGQFWEHESFDHSIRDDEEFARVIAYVLIQ